MPSPTAAAYVPPAIEHREVIAGQLMADSSVPRSPTWDASTAYNPPAVEHREVIAAQLQADGTVSSASPTWRAAPDAPTPSAPGGSAS